MEVGNSTNKHIDLQGEVSVKDSQEVLTAISHILRACIGKLTKIGNLEAY